MALFVEVCGSDRERLARALAGVRAYQAHPYRRAVATMPEIARVGSVVLRDYGGDGPAVVVVPSLINPPTVLDLAEGNSLLRWLGGQGVRPLLVDWGTPGPAELALDLGAMITERLLPMIAAAGPAPTLVGYCMGGTMALAAAALVPTARLALLATPWRFDGYDSAQRAQTASYSASVMPLAEALGALPMDLLQPIFWHLDPAAVTAKFEGFAALDPDSAAARAFVALEDWAGDGPPLSLPVYRGLSNDLLATNKTGRGVWEVGGDVIELSRIDAEVLNFVALRDRIVPAASAVQLGTRVDIDGGHVGMVVGSRARTTLWEPLARFLRED